MNVESHFICLFCKVIILDRINLCAFASLCFYLYIFYTILLTILTYLFFLSKAHNFHGFQGLLEHLIILLRRNRHVTIR